MQIDSWPSLAAALGESVRGRFVRRALQPDPWSLGLETDRGMTLGFCWHPAWLAAGMCRFRWPRNPPPDLLKFLLHGVRLGAVEAFPGEPILRVSIHGGRSGLLVFEALGRSANILLLRGDSEVLWSGRTLGGPSRSGKLGERWEPPPPRDLGTRTALPSPDPESALREGLIERGRAAALRDLARVERGLLRRAEAVRSDVREGGDPDTVSRLGQALLVSGDLNRRGEACREVQDFAQVPPVLLRVPLDPSLNVRENAERIFRKARKAKAREAESARIQAEIEDSLSNMGNERERLAASQRLEDFYAGGPARPRPRQTRRDLPKDVCRVPLPEGFSGYAGKSAGGNHHVSFRLGRGGDFWYHVADYPGCHVVVKNPGRLPALPPAVERAAALYAGVHSQAPPGNRVSVIAAQCKQIRPAPGLPGQVFLAGGRALLIDLPPR